MFTGSIVALVTPMHSDGTLDKKTLCELVEWHIHCKTNALVVAGTTGESATLDMAEKQALLTCVIQQAAGRIPIIAGTGTNNTKTTVSQTQAAQHAGADACLIVTPYYNKPTQKGLFQHYKIVAEQVVLPIILYNVPGRTGCDLLPETVELLSQVPHIIGIKEATGKLQRAATIREHCGSQFDIYSCDDETALDIMLHGAQGVISVTANVAPQKMYAMCAAVLSGNTVLAKKINTELMPLHKKLFVESNPIPTKWVLQQMGKIAEGIRLPLLPLDAKYHQELKEAMLSAGVE